MRLFFFLFLGFLGFQGFTQNSFEPGYIISIEQDTIGGYILEGSDGEMGRKIRFKTDKNAPARIYKSKDLTGFTLDNGRVFEQFPIISPVGDTSYVFAKNVIRGKIDAFVWRHPNRAKPDFFLFNNSTKKTVQLTRPEKKVVKNKNGKNYSKKDYRYAGYLELIKEDSSVSPRPVPPVRYSEKRIKEDILAFNSGFSQEYPVQKYKEKIKYNYDIIGGLPTNINSGEVHFRAGIYRNKSRVERSTNFSVFQGLVYHHGSQNNKEIPVRGRDVTSYLNYRWQMLNFIPLGINFHGNSKFIQPYGYVGVGVAAVMMADHVVKTGEIQGNKIWYTLYPTLNLGVGTKIKMGKHSLITELTPTINGLFWNVGFSL